MRTPLVPMADRNKRRQLLSEIAQAQAPGRSVDGPGVEIDLSGKWIWGVSRFGGPTRPKVQQDAFVSRLDG